MNTLSAWRNAKTREASFMRPGIEPQSRAPEAPDSSASVIAGSNPAALAISPVHVLAEPIVKVALLPLKPGEARESTATTADKIPTGIGTLAAGEPHSKTEQLAETVPGCSRGDAASKGLDSPEYKPLMRKPREDDVFLQANRKTAGDTFADGKTNLYYYQSQPVWVGLQNCRPRFNYQNKTVA